LNQDRSFIDPHNLLRCLKKPTGPYSQPDESSSHYSLASKLTQLNPRT